MTKQPTPNQKKPWGLSYIPPKHLRLPDFDYGMVEETEERELQARRVSRKVLERTFKEMTKTLSSMSLASAVDEEERSDLAREGDLESACVSHQAPRPEMLRVCAISAYNANKSPMHSAFNVSLSDTNVL